MRLIKFALKNLLIVVATLVLFSSLSWAEQDVVSKLTSEVNSAQDNQSIVLACTGNAPLLKKARLDKSVVTAVKADAETQIMAELASKNSAASTAAVAEGGGHVAAKGNAELIGFTNRLAAACKVACLNAQEKLRKDDPVMSYGDAKGKMKNAYNDVCVEDLDKYAAYYAAGMNASEATAFSANKARKSLLTKVAIGGAAIGGGLLVMDHINDKKDKKKEKKAEEEKYRADNGIIKDADGNDLQCFAQANYMRLECAETMLGLCQGAKADTGGCRSFNSTYCASSGSGSNYCLYADAKTYCAQTGSVIAQSPACVWASARSAECKKTPENVSCLYSGSAEALTLACQNFPNDPLCAAHSAGRIVVQGGSSAAETMAATTGEGTTDGAASGSSVSMASVIDSGNASNSVSSSSDAVTDSSTLSSNDSMWASSSTVAQSACAEGLLQDCGN